MRMMNRNKQELWFAELAGEVPVYETDDEGNIRYDEYTDTEGNVYRNPIEDGEPVLAYGKPQRILVNISFGSNETTTQEFGIDQSAYDAVIVYSRGEYPLTETCRIWHEEPEEIIGTEGYVSGDNADYKVVSVRSTLNEGKAILAHLTK